MWILDARCVESGVDWTGPETVHELVHSELWKIGRFNNIFTNNSARYLDHPVWLFIIYKF